jgi:hypothetical protein
MEMKTGLIIAHLVGLALGVGGATLMDLVMLRFMILGRITREHSDFVHFSSQLVAAGLVILWASGLAFLSYYSFHSPESLKNPKVYAKIAIVVVLTLNGFLIHKYVLPLIDRNVGKRLFDDVSRTQKMWMLTAGAISATSWYVPLALGALRELNFGTPASHILLGYAALVTAAILSAQAVGMLLEMKDRQQLVRSEVRPARLPT